MKGIPFGSILAFSIAALACEAKVSAIDSPNSEGRDGGCDTNAQCIDANGGAAYVCRKDNRTCIPLATTDCQVYAEQADIRNDNTIWLGAVYTKSGEGAQRSAAVDLARSEIASAMGGLPPAAPGGPTRPLGFVVCDEAAATPTAHLIDDLQVPAILGYVDSSRFIAAAAETAKRHVLLMGAGPSSPQITQLSGGSPRLVYRTTPSDALVALAMAKSVAAVEESAARARTGASSGPLRVALVSNDSVIGDVLTQNVSINGKNFVEAAASGSALAVAYSAAPTDAELASATDKLAVFKPDIVVALGGAEVGPKIVDALESAWTTLPRPLYVLNDAAVTSLTQELGTSADLRHRTVVVDPDMRPSLFSFRAQLSAQNANLPAPAAAIGTTYDAVYTLAYSIVANSAKPITGENLVEGMPVLLNSTGRVIPVGPSGLFSGMNALVAGTSRIDLDGVSGPLDFNLQTGDVNADMEIGCIGATGEISPSGAVFRYASGTFEGQAACP
jgi:ABC-type branched-subunit amino acid transport system substrate-binding protein